MASIFAAQLQPFEEHQSPSPTEERENPYELALARSRSSGKKPGPSSPIDTLHRQLSGDPDAPPPAWKRRASHHRSTSGSSPISPTSISVPSVSPSRSPSESMHGARRHVSNLSMTMTAPPAFPAAQVAELGLPQPAFRRKSGLSSNRSSMHSLNGLTSEDLWRMDQEASQPDLSNPLRQASERPLDTVRRMSRRIETGQWHGDLPGEVIWPTAPEIMPTIKSKSSPNVASQGKRKMTLGRKKSTINASTSPISPQSLSPNDVYIQARSVPVSPAMPRPESMILSSSAHSSSTSLNSQGVPIKSINMARPPSAYYNRDFLLGLAPREGGYAIAATMSQPPVEDRRKSTYEDRTRRAPMARSAGMGRWSLDGGEHYIKPYGTSSANTTSSNLSAPPINSALPSPTTEERPTLPTGASPPSLAPTKTRESAESTSAISTTSIPQSIPANPSPLSQQTHANDFPTPTLPVIPIPPIPVEPTPAPAAPGLTKQKSKKELKKEAKSAQKDAELQLARKKAEQLRAEQAKKDAAAAAERQAKLDRKNAEIKAKEERKLAEAKAKEEAKRKAQAEKPQPTGILAAIPGRIGASSSRVDLPVTQSASAPPPKKLGFFGTLKKKLSGAPDKRSRQTSSASSATASAPTPPTKPGTPAPVTTARQLAGPVPRTEENVLMPDTGAAGSFGPSVPVTAPIPAQDEPYIALIPSRTPPSSFPANMPTQSRVPLEPFPQSSATPAPMFQTNLPPAKRHSSYTEHSRSLSSGPSVPLVKSMSRDFPVASHYAGREFPVSRDTAVSPSADGSTSARRTSSIRGPRPMPVPGPVNVAAAPSSPRHSIVTTPSTETALVTPATAHPGFPFQSQSIPLAKPIIPSDSLTPTTSSDSYVFRSETESKPSTLESPFTSVASGDSTEGGVSAPVREGSAESKASEVTVRLEAERLEALTI